MQAPRSALLKDKVLSSMSNGETAEELISATAPVTTADTADARPGLPGTSAESCGHQVLEGAPGCSTRIVRSRVWRRSSRVGKWRRSRWRSGDSSRRRCGRSRFICRRGRCGGGGSQRGRGHGRWGWRRGRRRGRRDWSGGCRRRSGFLRLPLVDERTHRRYRLIHTLTSAGNAVHEPRNLMTETHQATHGVEQHEGENCDGKEPQGMSQRKKDDSCE